jgi:lauroyl/myristoyl acyltransferase
MCAPCNHAAAGEALCAASRKCRATRSAYRALGLAGSRSEANGLVTANLQFTLAYYTRLAALARRKHSSMRVTVGGIGLAGLERAVALGQGAVVVTVHLGDFDLAGCWLGRRLGQQPVVPIARDAWRGRQAFYDHARRSAGLALYDSHSIGTRDLVGQLEKGRVVVLMLDRAVGGRKVGVNFLGKPARLPATPLHLGQATGAGVFPAATWTDDTGERRIDIAPAVDVLGDDGASGTQELADVLGRAIRGAPAQWHVPRSSSQLPWTVDRASGWSRR